MENEFMKADDAKPLIDIIGYVINQKLALFPKEGAKVTVQLTNYVQALPMDGTIYK